MKNVFYPLLSILFVVGYSNAQNHLQHPTLLNYDSLVIYSTFVKEDRKINVWTPPIYSDSSVSLPVLYMPDGGTKEDFPHIVATLAKLIKEHKIPAIMLVGIENTVRGRDLTGESQVKEHEEYNIPMTDGAKDFRAFIIEELIPEINRRYRTTERKGIVGESLAGLFVMETFFLMPASFDFYIAMDPSLWWNDNYLVKHSEQFLARLPERPTKLWFAGSNAEDIYKHTNLLAEKLKNDPPRNLVWEYSPEPNEEHSTIFKATKEKAFIWIMNH